MPGSMEDDSRADAELPAAATTAGAASDGATAGQHDELARVLGEHERWLASDELQGARADLSRAQLDGLDLARADLSGAVVRGASLVGADLRQARLTHADFTDAVMRGARLSGASLQLADFSGADLTGVDLSATTPEGGHEQGQMRRGPRFRDTILKNARLTGAFCNRSEFTGSQMSGCDLTGATLSEANLAGLDLSGVSLRGADLHRADLTASRLNGADLRECRLTSADCSGADLSDADIRGADLRGANLNDTRVERIRYDRRARFRGIRASRCYGSSRFRRFAQDQDFIEEYKEAHPLVYRLWLVLTDCGRSMQRVVLWSAALTMAFAGVYLALGEASFAMSNGEALEWSPFVALYYSVVTITTLGFGDITPRTPVAAAVVMVEVVLGYLMLGILISILASKVARRA